MADITLIYLDNLQSTMAMSKKAQHNRESGAAVTDNTASSESKPKVYKFLGWRNFGLFKPSFKFGLRRKKNPEYEKGYN